MPQTGHFFALPSCKGAGSCMVDPPKREGQRFATQVHCQNIGKRSSTFSGEESA